MYLEELNNVFQKGKTTRKAMPNSKSLEFVHSVILTKRVDFTAVNIPPAVMKVIHRYIILERASSDKWNISLIYRTIKVLSVQEPVFQCSEFLINAFTVMCLIVRCMNVQISMAVSVIVSQKISCSYFQLKGTLLFGISWKKFLVSFLKMSWAPLTEKADFQKFISCIISEGSPMIQYLVQNCPKVESKILTINHVLKYLKVFNLDCQFTRNTMNKGDKL